MLERCVMEVEIGVILRAILLQVKKAKSVKEIEMAVEVLCSIVKCF